MRFWTGQLPVLLGVLAVGGLLLGAQPASATNSCLHDLYNTTGPLNCTANDISIADVTHINIVSGGSCTTVNGVQTCTCDIGSPPPTDCSNPSTPGCVTFDADFKVLLTAQTRYDIGFYIATDGDAVPPGLVAGDGALTGQCQAFVITQAEERDVNGAPSPGNFTNADGDSCGNIDATHNPQYIRIRVSTACVPDANNNLKLPTCTTWQQPGKDTVCSGAPAFPGSPSKCNCNAGFAVTGIHPEHPGISVTKTPNPTHITENTPTDITYTVTVTNLGNQASVTITSLNDTPYGNITTTGHNGITSTTCVVPQTIVADTLTPGPGQTANPYTCSFTVSGVTGEPGQSITDTVCASGTDANGGAVGPTCGTAIVTVDDVKPTATVIKTVQSASCALVTYQVQVVNTDQKDVLTLNALSDSVYGDITKDKNSTPTPNNLINRTDCSVPKTLQIGDGQPGGTDTYSCTFDAFACVGDTDTVTATVVDDEGSSPTTPPSGSATLTGVTVTGTHTP